MKNKTIIRLFTAALAVALCATAFAVPAFAGGGEDEPYYTETAEPEVTEPVEEEPQEEPPEEEPRINPLHDMDSLEFLLWAEEGARAQIARKKAQQQTPESPKKQP